MPHKLLLADDSITIQRVIELTFADEDVQVLAVGDGKKAIESIQADRPDIVLADVGMPERDGYEVAEFIKRNPQLANIPVLLLTGAFEPIDETRARAVGCDGVLVKPFEPQMVINRVKDLLAGRRSGGVFGGKPATAVPERAAAPSDQGASAQPAAAAPTSSTSASLEDYFDRLDAAFASVEAATEARSVASAITHTSSTAPVISMPGAAPSSLSTDDFPGWDPDLTGDPQRPAAAALAPAAQAPAAEPSPPEPVVPLPAAVIPPPAAIVSPPARTAEPAAPVPPATHLHHYPVEHVEAPSVVSPPSVSADAVLKPAARPAVDVPVSVPTVSTPTPSLAEAFAALLSAEQGRRVSPSTAGSAPMTDDAMDEIVSRVLARMTDKIVREMVIDVAERLVREEIERIKAAQ